MDPIKKQANLVAVYRAEKLEEISKNFLSAMHELDDNPLIQKKWSFFTRFMHKLSGIPLPPTPFEIQKHKLIQLYKEQEASVDKMIEQYIHSLGYPKAEKGTHDTH